MQYVLLIYTEEPTEAAVGRTSWSPRWTSYNAFTEHVRARGAMQAGEALQPSATATTVRVRDGQTIATDGPFAETKEALGGFYLVEAADLDEAIGYAAMIPGAKYGSIEVRPVFDFAAARRRRPCPKRSAPTDEPRRPDAATREVVDRLFREESGRAVATLIRVLGDFDLAEEAVQEAFVTALEAGRVRGVPDNPGAWITTTARNRAIDRLRRRRRLREKTEELARDAAIEAELGGDRAGGGRWERRRHADRRRPTAPDLHVLPSGPADGRAGGADAAHARWPHDARDRPSLPRARDRRSPSASSGPSGRSATPGIPYRVPPRELLPERLDGVLKVLYLVFNEGYAASSGDALDPARAERARRSGWHGPSCRCSPTSPRRPGCWRSCSSTTPAARRASGTGGELVLLEDQDRSRWDAGPHRGRRGPRRARPAAGRRRAVPAPGRDRRRCTTRPRTPGARTGCRSPRCTSPSSGSTRHRSSQLNLAVAVAMADGPAVGLALMDGLADEGALAGYPYLHAASRRPAPPARTPVRGRRRLSQRAELTANRAERDFLERRLAAADRDAAAGPSGVPRPS